MAASLANSRCDLCGADDFRLIARRDRNGDPLDTLLCRRCGLVRHRTIPTEQELLGYYRHEYRRQYNGETEPSPRRVMRAWKNARTLVRRLSPLVPKRHRVLDVGAGLGAAVKAFELAGYRAEGLEPGESFCRFGRRRLRAPIRAGSLFDLPADPAFETVLLVHVIEHFASPRKALDHVHNLMTPGGLLYVECPNLLAPFAPRGRLFHRAHIHNFTPSSLAALVRACGFELVQRFSSDRHVHLQMLFRRVDDRRLQIDANSAAAVRSVLKRCGVVRYHLRATYLAARTRKLASYALERVLARRFVRRITLRSLDAADPQPKHGPATAVAAIPSAPGWEPVS